MSTFGNKALIWWDYHKHDRDSIRRFSFTPKDLQLEILKKWYPIGMMVGFGDNKYKHEIVEYSQHSTFWHVKVIWKLENNSIMNGMQYIKHPLNLYPSPEWEMQIKRQSKLNRLV